MRAGFTSVVLAATLSVTCAAGLAAESITVTFDDLSSTGLDALVGVDTDPSTPESGNIGYQGLYWAWTGSGVVGPGMPANDGFRLGNRILNPDFSYVGGSSPQFAYVSSRTDDAYITKIDQPFAFLGGVFSSVTPGTLSIVGQIHKNGGNGIGGGTFEDIPGAIATIVFDDSTTVVQLNTLAFASVDRLVISSAGTGGTSFQWALDDFTYAPVPEPSTWAMLGLGLAAVGCSVQRRRRKSH